MTTPAPRLACVRCASKNGVQLSGEPTAMGACSFGCGSLTAWREATATEISQPGRPLGTPPEHEEVNVVEVHGRHTCLACSEFEMIPTTYPVRTDMGMCQFCKHPSAYREKISVKVPTQACKFCSVTRVRSSSTPS